MKNNYFYNDIEIIDIIFKKNKIKVIPFFLLKDGTEIKAKGTEIFIKCNECGSLNKRHFSLHFEDKFFVCRHCSTLCEKNPFYGKKHSPELKEKLSKERKGKWGVGENNPMYGKKCEDFMTEEAIKRKREKFSKSMTGEKNPMYGHNIKEFMTEEKYNKWKHSIKETVNKNFNSKNGDEIRKKLSISQQIAKERDPEYYRSIKAKAGRVTCSKANHYKKTKPEITVEEWLKNHNIEYNYSPIMGDGTKNYQYDFIIRNKRILIEVNGDYWHGNPLMYNINGTDGKKKLNEIQIQKIETDKIKLNYAIEHDFKLIYIWEKEINSNDFTKLEKELLNETNIPQN